VKEMRVLLFKKKEVERSETDELNIGEGVRLRDEQRDVDQTGDCSINQEQNDNKFYLLV